MGPFTKALIERHVRDAREALADASLSKGVTRCGHPSTFNTGRVEYRLEESLKIIERHVLGKGPWSN